MAEGQKIICVSGGFDPLHSGHIQYIQDAANYGDAVVILNSDAWLERKKGKAFMPWEQRAEILRAIKGVTAVVPVDDADGTVCKALKQLRPHYFAKGGDRTAENTPELALCCELGIKPVFGVGGSKMNSSSALLANWSPQKSWMGNPVFVSSRHILDPESPR